ncbi:MAG: hypothetical protein JNM60_05045 [Candidatus Competibacteraceae bacterium]|nr:hypothetical protein [Candidatus Competibacteraceae bacterium]
MNALARRRWLNLGLLVAVAGLATLALLEPERGRFAEPAPLLEIAPEQLERIAVERPGQEALAFERREGRWWLTAPLRGPANPALLEPLLRLHENRCPLRYPVAEVDLKALRLDPPTLRLRWGEQDIRFGATAPTDGQRYLQIGATVYLCPDQLYPLLTSSAGGFLAPSIETLFPDPKSAR